MQVENRPSEFIWGNQQINDKHNDDPEKKTKLKAPYPKQTNDKIYEDGIRFSDDNGATI